MISLSLFLKLLIITLYVFPFSFQQQCIQGENCPYNQGICVSNTCQCNQNYHSLIDETLPAEQQIYCNYRKYSQYFPIILEFVAPSLGHFLVGNYWKGLIKLSLIIIFVSSSFYLYKRLKIPELFVTLFESIGLSGLFGGGVKEGDDKKDDDNGALRLRSSPNRPFSQEISDGVEDDYEEDNVYLKFVFEISGILLPLLYFLDLLLYKFKVYNDGNGVPFV